MIILNTSAHEVTSQYLNSELSPEPFLLVPKNVIATKNESRALVSIFSLTNAYTIDSSEDSFDDDKEDNMLDIYIL